MAVLDRTTKQKQSAGLLFGGLILGAILFSGVLLSSASRLSDHTGSQTGQLFGLRLFELTKQPMAGGGFTASMNFFFNSWQFTSQLGFCLVLWPQCIDPKEHRRLLAYCGVQWFCSYSHLVYRIHRLSPCTVLGRGAWLREIL